MTALRMSQQQGPAGAGRQESGGQRVSSSYASAMPAMAPGMGMRVDDNGMSRQIGGAFIDNSKSMKHSSMKHDRGRSQNQEPALMPHGLTVQVYILRYNM